MKGKRNLFLAYLQKNQKWFFLIFTLFFCFYVVFYLNHLPIAPILYATLLYVYIGVIFLIVDYVKFRNRYRILQLLQKTITIQNDELPPPNNIIEERYQELIRILFSNRNEMAALAENKQKDLVDYFTQWTHQIKTPIAAMRLLLQTGQNEQYHDLDLELFKIEQYVQFVLQYLRLHDMSNDLEIKRIDLDDLIKQAIRKNAKPFILKKISLHYNELNCAVLTDEKWLLFVIEQVLSNALKYTNKGSIFIYMEPNPNKKLLVIEDTGIGIRSEDLPRIFEKGFTGYNGRTYKGATGIGLYLCKQILTKLSHEIIIQSEQGKGTKVIIDLTTVNLQTE